jgi:hypothetical protein
MTKKQAKKITLEVWTYLRDHPEIDEKYKLPKKLYNKIKYLICECALCHTINCNKCPLALKKSYRCMEYDTWTHAVTSRMRKNGASEVVRLVKAWKV